jgi:hypothetical protein
MIILHSIVYVKRIQEEGRISHGDFVLRHKYPKLHIFNKLNIFVFAKYFSML